MAFISRQKIDRSILLKAIRPCGITETHTEQTNVKYFLTVPSSRGESPSRT